MKRHWLADERVDVLLLDELYALADFPVQRDILLEKGYVGVDYSQHQLNVGPFLESLMALLSNLVLNDHFDDLFPVVYYLIRLELDELLYLVLPTGHHLLYEVLCLLYVLAGLGVKWDDFYVCLVILKKLMMVAVIDVLKEVQIVL